MRVLAIVGSPRKGNTYRVVQLIEEFFKNNSEVQFECLELSKVNLKQCTGCFVCISNGEEHCPLNDDRNIIEEKMLSSDGIIFACPVYACHISGLMKNFLERFAYYYHRPKLFRKKGFIIVTSGGSGMNESLKFLNFTQDCWKVDTVQQIGVKTNNKPNEEFWEQEYKKMTPKLQKFIQKLSITKEEKPRLYDLVYFEMWKKIIQNDKELKYDQYYWKEKDWLSESYYYKVKVNRSKTLIAKSIAALILVTVGK